MLVQTGQKSGLYALEKWFGTLSKMVLNHQKHGKLVVHTCQKSGFYALKKWFGTLTQMVLNLQQHDKMLVQTCQKSGFCMRSISECWFEHVQKVVLVHPTSDKCWLTHVKQVEQVFQTCKHGFRAVPLPIHHCTTTMV